MIYSDTSSPVINALVASNRKIRASFFQYKARIGLSQIGTGSGSGRVSVVPRNLSGTVGTQVTISDPVIKIDTETLSQQQGGVRLEVSQKDIIFRFSTANQTRTGLLTNEDWIKFDNKIDKNNFQNFSGIRSVVGLTVSSNNFQFEPYPVSTGLSPNTLVLRDNNNRFKADSPLDPQDVANKVYVDNLVAAGATYAPINAKVATNENVNLSNPPSSIDGVQLDDNDVVLVKNQNTPSQNGIYQYKVNSSGVPSLERHPSYDTSAELRLNLIFYVEQGAINGGLSFRVTKNNFGLEIEFLPVARPFSITPSNGISVTNGNVIAVNADSYSFTFLPNGKLALIDRLNITNSERTVTVQPPFSLKVNTTGIITEIQPISHNDFISSLQLVCRALNSGQASVAPNSFVHFEGEGYIPSSTPFLLRHRSFIKVHPTDSQIYFLSNPNEVPIDSGTGNLSPNQFVRHSNVHFRGTIAYKIVTVSPSIYRNIRLIQ
ncbi:MAG: hypothetical protein RML35_00845 [Chloroherpetonaceae bacterium]|nr:hypothetical protein [Chloroherpetonaceae bacterium]